MSAQVFTSVDGTYLVNWGAVSRILRAYIRSDIIARNCRPTTEKNTWGPDLVTMDVPWKVVESETSLQAEYELGLLYRNAQQEMRPQIRYLEHLTVLTAVNNQKFLAMQKEAQSATMDNIEASVRKGEIGVEVMTGLRDTCAEAVLVSATMLTAGAALAAVTTGSFIKSLGKWQDTHNKRDAIATFGTEFIIGVADVKIIGKLEHLFKTNVIKKVERYALTVVWAKAKGLLETPKGILQGEDVSTSTMKTGVKMTTAWGTEALGDFLETKLGKGAAFPIMGAVSFFQDKLSEHIVERTNRRQEPAPAPANTRAERMMEVVHCQPYAIEQSVICPLSSH